MGERYCGFPIDELEVFKVNKWKNLQLKKKNNNLE